MPAPIRTREETWRWRIAACGLVLTAIYVFLLAGSYKSGNWILNRGGRPILSDFTPIWIAGRDALDGHALRAYNLGDFHAAQRALVGPRPHYYFWPYPPIFFLPAALVALLPYALAFIFWEAAAVAAFLALIYRILGERTALIAALASPLLVYSCAVGQNGALTATLIGGGLFLLKRWPLAAGCLIGCLAYKPQFDLILPLALLISGEWGALSAAAAATIVLIGASSLLFGVQVWTAFWAGLLKYANVALIVGVPSGTMIQSLWVLLRHLGLGVFPSAAFQVAMSLAAAGLVCFLWRSGASYSLKAAAAATASLLVSPYLFVYDLVTLLVAGAFLAADYVERGSSRVERALLIALFCAQFLVVGFDTRPLGFPFGLALFALILWRARGQIAAGPKRSRRGSLGVSATAPDAAEFRAG